jgi:uncharacterized protein YprB with RNaseH-like and TPR domain
MRILFYDLETAPNIGYTWEKWETNVLGFIKEREILSCAYKWQGDKKVSVISAQGQKSDKNLVKKLHRLFEQADIVIAHNGDKFDQGIAKARMIYHKMSPPRILQSVDTRKAAKNNFKFNGNGLEDLGKFLKLGSKRKHSGFDMWLGCMEGKKSSWKEMIKYNKQDVVLLEKVYNRLKPWIHNHPCLSEIKDGCPQCGSKNVVRKGYRATQATIKQQMQCKSCNSWYLVKKAK